MNTAPPDPTTTPALRAAPAAGPAPAGWLARLRFWLGLNAALLIATLLTRTLTPGAAPLTPRGVLLCLLLTALGFALGLAYARYWPLPAAAFARVGRTLLLAVPTVGLSLALGLLLRPEISALVLALAAFLGAQWRPAPGPMPTQSRPPQSR
ncbi:hypothetical protein [Deinococcus knuensis]|uniref:Uncharacterized protein n=1 Tax=Deinococcus knuensis TaxID=1837380 RepID=A0ABQ2SL62_9DEIO|nr:hypothetical protein [Deinococcus knuensis]GGS32873.1 hypothetical protein GCM10008961_25740 [Deinococcus knuensis]